MSAADFFQQAEEVVAEVRDSRRPGFLVIDTRRLGPHSKGDDLRPDSVKQAISQRDPLTALGQCLPEQTRAAIESRNQVFIGEVEMAASASPEASFPEPPRHIFTGAPPANPGSETASFTGRGGDNVRTHLNSALHHLLETSDRTIVLGEDLHDCRPVNQDL